MSIKSKIAAIAAASIGMVLTVTFVVIVISVLPAFSLTPEQCNAATESCIGKCDPRDLANHEDCVAACSSKLSGPCAANLRGSPAANKGPPAPTGPTKGP